ncbi:MAG: alpha/beta hydrolase [Alphaproteobacteria bacterium]
MKKILCFLIAVYLGVCALVRFYPLPFFYNPSDVSSNVENAKANGYNPEVVNYQSSDLTDLFAWYTKPQKDNHKAIIFMHGNSYNVEEFYYKLKTFADEGYATFIPEYRGFGGLRGEVSQTNLANDAIAAVEKLNSMGYKNNEIYVYGMSLGTFMATNSVVNLQKNGNFAGLILEVPFDSLLNTAKAKVPFLPLDYIVKDKYETINIIENVKTKILIMLGTNDATIPYELGKELYKKAPEPKELIVYKGGKHSNLFNFRNDKDILKWLEK